MEVAIATVILLAFVLGVVDFGRMHFCRSRLQYAVSQATRFAVVGSALPDPADPRRKLSRTESIIHLIRSFSGLPNLKTKDVKISSLDSSGKPAEGAGGPGDVVTVRAVYHVPLVAPFLAAAFDNHEYQFQVATSFRNEEF